MFRAPHVIYIIPIGIPLLIAAASIASPNTDRLISESNLKLTIDIKKHIIYKTIFSFARILYNTLLILSFLSNFTSSFS